MNPLLTLPQLSLAAVLLAAAPLGFAAPYESAPRVYLDQLLPGTLIRSGNHRVLSEIRPQRNTIEFEIESDYGFYRVRSIPMVIQRVHEIRTLAQAVNHFESQNNQLATELRGQLQVGGDSFVDIIASPFQTTADLVDQATQNVGQTFQELHQIADGQSTGGQGTVASRSISRSGLYRTLVPDDPVLAAYKRSAASQLDLDAYSTNPRVQEFLNALARARPGGQPSAGSVAVTLPPRAEVAIAGGRVEGRVRSIMTHKTIEELEERNADRLTAAGMPDEVIAAFLAHPVLSPRHKTAATEYLQLLEGVADREVILQAALDASDEVEAAYFIQMVRMLAHYHEREGRRKGLLLSGHIAIGITESNAVLVVVPFDLVYWNRETDEIFSELAVYANRKNYAGREILVSGVLTAQARAQFAELGYDVRERFLFRN